MISIKRIFQIIQSEFSLEFRNIGSLLSVALFLVASVYITFLLFNQLSPSTWLAILWLIILLFSLQAFSSMFLNEMNTNSLYYYSIYHPIEILITKIIYHTMRLFVFSLLGIGFLSLFHSFPILHLAPFFISLIAGCLTFSTVLTITSALSQRTRQSSNLLPLLSFPLLIPFLLGIISISYKSVLEQMPNYQSDIILLIGLLLLVLAMSLIFFPLLWKD